ERIARRQRQPCRGDQRVHSNPVTLVTPTPALHRPNFKPPPPASKPHRPENTGHAAGATDGLAAPQTAIATPRMQDQGIQLGTIEMSASDDFKHASPPRHPCCAGPEDSNPIAFVTRPAPSHRPGIATDDHTATTHAMAEGEGK
ncbi:MAG: hypothetical protein J0I79_02215, partial [Mesorhizobium sp.]|uniref:hypothetical protein n=1 Tax=Mesorhizobium sp. TaxID=1871066 RepID=UPI001AC8FCA2